MKKINCNVIRDLLPLYIEQVVSSDTKILVEEHLSECEDCKAELNRMQAPIKITLDNDAGPLQNIKKKWNHKKLCISILTAVFVTILFIAGLFLYQLELPVQYSDAQIWTEEVEMQAGFKSFQVNIKGRNIDMKEETVPVVIPNSDTTLHYRVFRTTFLRNLFDSGEHTAAVGVGEYWNEIDQFESNLVFEFADRTIVYRNGKRIQ